VNVGHERNCIAKIVLSQFAVPEQLSRLIVSTGFLDHDPIIAALLALAAWLLEIRATKSAAVNSKFSDLIPWESQSRGSDCEPRTKTGRHFS